MDRQVTFCFEILKLGNPFAKQCGYYPGGDIFVTIDQCLPFSVFEATLDSCKMLINLHQLLDKLDAMSLKRAGKTVQ